MSSKIKILQVIPKLGYGGAETGCFDLAHYLHEHNCKSYIVTSGGPLLKYINKKKVKILRLPVQSKNPILILLNSLILGLETDDYFASKFGCILNLADKFILILFSFELFLKFPSYSILLKLN